MAERGIDQTIYAKRRCCGYRQHEVVHLYAVAEIQQAKDLTSRNILDTVLSVGERGLKEHEVNQLRKGQRDHRKLNAAAANGYQAEKKTNEGRGHDAKQYRQERRQLHHLGRVAGNVGGAANERGVAKGQHTAVPKQQVERRGDKRHAHQLHQQEGIHVEWRCDGYDCSCSRE